ncbi:MAG: phosphotransferase [Chloroflexi bacterium]|nr:phosphotransferase [Chloroflexota bacterium]
MLRTWLPAAILIRDHSWGLVGTTVLEVRHGPDHLVVKAGDANDHHIARELRAHQLWLSPWTSTGHAGRLRWSDGNAKLLVTDFVPGELVLRHPSAAKPDTYRQAGALLARFHHQVCTPDADYEARENRKSLGWLDQPHRIAPDVQQRLRSEINAWPTSTSVLVPTHGDWQPRNWVVDREVVRVIDFGRADLRPAACDFARLAAQEFRRDPHLEAAFLDGYGTDPREAHAWHRIRVREAIGTAVWAYQVGDEAFEAQGHRMIAEALD